MSREKIAGAAVVSVALAVLLVGGATTSASSSINACRAAQLRFVKPFAQPAGSVQVGYGIRIKNIGRVACTLHRFLIVRVPKGTLAPLDVVPRLTSALLPAVDFRRPLVVATRHSVATYLVVTAPCGGLNARIGVPLRLAVEVPYGQTVRYFTEPLPIWVCRTVSNRIDLPPLAAA